MQLALKALTAWLDYGGCNLQDVDQHFGSHIHGVSRWDYMLTGAHVALVLEFLKLEPIFQDALEALIAVCGHPDAAGKQAGMQGWLLG